MADDGKDWIEGDGEDGGEEEREDEEKRNGKVQTAPSRWSCRICRGIANFLRNTGDKYRNIGQKYRNTVEK